MTVGSVDWMKDGGDRRRLSSCSINDLAEDDDDCVLSSFFS